MKKRTIATVVVGAVLATGAAGGAVALASGSGDDHESSTHEGAATGPDADGSTVDVRLDGNLHVLATEADQETEAR